MPTKRTSEDDDMFDLDWEDDIDDDEELDDDNDDNNDFEYDSLSSSEKKRYDKMKKAIEDSVVDALANGDTNSPVYKGMQRVVSQKDRELIQYRQALAGVIEEVKRQQGTGDEVTFLRDIVESMLDDDSKREMNSRYEQFANKRKADKNEQMLQSLLQQGQQQSYPQYGAEEEDPQIVAYRKEATKKLESLAKKMGADPEKDGLDYGDESEPLLSRMDKLVASIERTSNERDERDLDSVRRKGVQPKTRTNNSPRERDADYGVSLIEKGTQTMIQRMRNNK